MLALPTRPPWPATAASGPSRSSPSYLHDPKGAIPGNKMAFVGVTDNAELADLVAYLRTLSDSRRVPLPQ